MRENSCYTLLTWTLNIHCWPQKHMPSSQTCAQWHPVHRNPSCCSSCMDSVVVWSQRRTDVCSHEQPRFLQPGLNGLSAPSSSPWIIHKATHSRTHWPALPGHDELCLACFVASAMKINQLLFWTGDHKCVRFISTFVEIWWQDCWFTTGLFQRYTKFILVLVGYSLIFAAKLLVS